MTPSPAVAGVSGYRGDDKASGLPRRVQIPGQRVSASLGI